MMKRIIILLLPIVFAWPTKGQPTIGGNIHVLQDSLGQLGHLMYNEQSEPERLKANFAFVKTLVVALQTPDSYSFPFDSLDMISILEAPDDKFRIFSWHLPLNDGSYLYYGTIQLNTPDGSLKLYPLLDKTFEIENPDSLITQNTNWYGAQYYRMVPFGSDYLLLGWKGHTPLMTQKVIEVLRIERDGILLGKAIFEGDNADGKARMIYRFSKQAAMYMDYDTVGNRIVLDHIVPNDAKNIGQFEHYGPDMSYDAWELVGGKLQLIPDIPLMNLPSKNDTLYNDPGNHKTHPKSGFTIQ